jgi:SNF2 family DNA or RNA helicase
MKVGRGGSRIGIELIDTAHFIRNGNSKMARAACALNARARWAVTGTPIQNRLTDLASLLKFIRAHPYTDPKQFDADITHLWKTGQDEEAVKRLKHLSASILLRRAKGTISLPPRRDTQCPVDFTRDERAVYDSAREQTITRIDEALQKSSEVSRIGIYVNALQQIESLRLICNMGLYYHTRHNTSLSPTNSSDWITVAQQTFNLQREMGPMICLQCSGTLELTDDLITTQHNAQFSKCLRFTCGDCSYTHRRARQAVSCGHSPPCSIASVSINSGELEEIPGLILPDPKPLTQSIPSKVEALIADLNSQPTDIKWYIYILRC